MPDSCTQPVAERHRRILDRCCGTRKRRGARLAIACVAALVASACTSGDNASPTEIRIGVLDPLSGSNASQGLDALHGAELAAEVINNGLPGVTLPLSSTRGLPNLGNAKIKVVPADTAGKPAQGTTEAEKLVNDQKVVALTGAYQSSVTKTAAQAANRLGIPFVNGDSSADSLTAENLSWFFRTGPTDKTFGEAFFGVLRDQLSKGRNASKVAILHADDQYGNDGASVTTRLATDANAGFSVVAAVPFPTDTKDLKSHVQRVRAANPDVVFVLAFTDHANLFLDALKQLNYTPPAVMAYGAGFADPKFIDPAGAALDGMTRRVAWSAALGERNRSAKAVAAAFEEKYKAPLTETSARTFTAMWILAQAINDAASTTPDKIREALIRLDVHGRDTIMPWDGVKFDDNRQNTKARGVVEQRINQEWRIVYPAFVSNAEIVWPLENARGSR